MKNAFSIVGFLITFLIIGAAAAIFLPSFLENINLKQQELNNENAVLKINETMGTNIKKEGSTYNVSDIEKQTSEYIQKAREQVNKSYNLEDY